jgi:hypothetical protein
MTLPLLLRNTKPRVVVNERPPMRQYMLATVPGGRVHRWGEDELAAANVFEDLVDSDSVRGGDKEIACALPRKPGTDYSDMKVGTRVELFGAGGRLISQCRLERTPRTSGDYLTMDPSAMGYQVRLTDKEEARAIPLDAELGAWTEPSTQRRLNIIAAVWFLSATAGIASNGAGEATASLFFDFTSVIKEASKTAGAELWYDGQGIDIGTLLYDFIGDGTTVWDTSAGLSIDDLTTGAEYNSPNGTTALKQSKVAAGAGMKHAFLSDFYTGPGTGQMNNKHYFESVKVQDRSLLPLYGTWPEVGFLASDFIAYALSMWAPGIRFTTGPFGSLRASSFPIQHLTFKEPTTVQEMITAALKFELLEWSVRGTAQGPTFFLNPRGEREGRKRWRARVRPAKLTETGQQMDQVWNRAIVSFNGTDGAQHTVGPAGSGAQYIDPRCEDTDPLNPINEAGEDRTKHLSLSTIASPEGAAEVAQRFLEQCKLLDGSGEATLTGYVEDEHGILWPYDAVHSGDLIDFVDSSIPGYRYIVEATRTRSSRSVNIKIDAPPDSYENLLERLAVKETAAGIS